MLLKLKTKYDIIQEISEVVDKHFSRELKKKRLREYEFHKDANVIILMIDGTYYHLEVTKKEGPK